jgi:hypothetical protein
MISNKDGSTIISDLGQGQCHACGLLYPRCQLESGGALGHFGSFSLQSSARPRIVRQQLFGQMDCAVDKHARQRSWQKRGSRQGDSSNFRREEGRARASEHLRRTFLASLASQSRQTGHDKCTEGVCKSSKVRWWSRTGKLLNELLIWRAVSVEQPAAERFDIVGHATDDGLPNNGRSSLGTGASSSWARARFPSWRLRQS